MTTGKEVLGRLGPNTIVDLRVEKADDLDGKDDLRRTRVLDITDSFVVLEQPSQKIHPNRTGSIMGITYVTIDKGGNLARQVLDAKLEKVGDFKLRDDVTEALFFDYPFKAYFASVRRHFRAEIPPDEDVFVVITDLTGKPIGSENRYRIMDLSLQGIRFMCKKGVKTKDRFISDPVSRLSVKDEILTRIFIDQQEVLWTRSIIRARLVPKSREGDVRYFGIEFSQMVTTDDEGKKIRFRKYTDKDQRQIMPHIINLQRKALRKERGA